MSNASEQTPDQQVERYRSLLEVTEAIALHRDLHELFRDLAQRLPQVVSVHFVGLSLYNAERNTVRLHTLQANVPAEIIGGHESSLENSPAGFVWQQQDALIVHDVNEEHRWPETIRRMKEDGINSFCVVPLTTPAGRLGAIFYLDVLTAKRNLYEAELALTATRRLHLVSIVQLYKALGGGWAPAMETAAIDPVPS